MTNVQKSVPAAAELSSAEQSVSQLAAPGKPPLPLFFGQKLPNMLLSRARGVSCGIIDKIPCRKSRKGISSAGKTDPEFGSES